MKRHLSLILAMICVLMMTACAAETPAPTAPTTPTTAPQKEDTALDNTKTYRLLMIGNSYTYYNDLWDMVRDAAASAGYTFEVDHVTQGGYYLDQHAATNNPFGVEIEKKLSENTYDYVFLQEQSTCAIVDYDRFEAGAKALHEKIEKNGAKTVLYQTWARKEGCVTLKNYNWTVASMTLDLQKAYEKLGKDLNATVSPVGTAFFRVVTKHPEIELYDPDETHPSLAGSYVAALTHVVTLTGIDVNRITYDAGLDADTVAVLKQAVADAVAQDR